MAQSGTRRWTRAAAMSVVTAMVATAAIVVTLLPPKVAEAARTAPTGPTPACVVSDTGTQGLGCLPGDPGGSVSGQFAAGGKFKVITDGDGLAPCYWYTDTGCYYTLFTPTLTRCVYLANNDAADVRSCGSLSTRGSVSAQRQGTCSGTLGSTFAQGGDPPWNVRAYSLADCTFAVTPADRPIDNLLGPTFWLVKTSVNECIEPGGGYGCDESWATLERHDVYTWLPVAGTLAPHAAFDANESSTTPGYFSFHNRSEPYATGTTTWEWTFGDGATSTTSNPSHQYAMPGTYTVTLTMRNTANVAKSVSREVVVNAPELRVAVYNPDAEFGPGDAGNRYSLNQTFPVRIVVSTGKGLGDLTAVAPIGDLLDIPPQLELQGEPQLVSPFTLGSDADRIYDATVKTIHPGRFSLISRWNATDAADRAAGPKQGALNGSVSGLAVEVTVDPPKFSLDEDTNGDEEITAEDNDVTISVEVTNVSDGPITDITFDELDLSSNLLNDASVWLELQTAPSRGFTDLPSGGSDTLEWVYRATDAVDAKADISVTGTAAGFDTTTTAEANIRVFTTKLIEAEITLDNQPLTAGKTVRISGTFTNVTDENAEPTIVSFGVGRTLSGAFGEPDGNGGNAYFSRPGSETAQGMEMFELAPGESIDLDSIVFTMPTEAPSGFTVSFQIYPYIPDEGPPPKYVPASGANAEISEEDGSSAVHSVQLVPVAATPEDTNWISCSEELLATFYVGCKLGRGVETALRGLVGVGVLGYRINVAYQQAKVALMRKAYEFLSADEAARLIIVNEIVADLVKLKAAGYESLQAITPSKLLDLVGDATYRAIDRTKNLLATGDLKLITGELAEFAGENIDTTFEALVAARTLVKTMHALGGRAGLLRTSIREGIEAERTKAIAAADRVIAEQGERALPGSRVIPAGVDVTDLSRIWKAWGVSRADLEALFKIAEDEGVTIVFRSRSPKSVDLIDSGLALPKPQGVKTKGVNDLDMDFLGYPEAWDSKVFVVEPPMPVHPKGSPERAQAIQQYLDSNHQLNSISDDVARADVRKALESRLETRSDEWITFEADRAQWTGDVASGGGIKVDFDPEFNDLPRRLIETTPNVEGRLIEHTLDGGTSGTGRKAYQVQMAGPAGTPPGPDGTTFRDITGDIDFLAILTPDGRMLGDTLDALQRLAELDKRARIYQKMQALLGMQHGESFTILNPKVRAKYLKDGLDAEDGETLLAATPQKRLMTAFFDDRLSTLEGGPNVSLIDNYQRSFFDGLFGETVSPPRTLNLLTLAELIRAHDGFRNIAGYFGLSIFGRIVGLAGSNVQNEFDRSGEGLKPNDGGGVDSYSAPGGPQQLTSVEYPYGQAGGRWSPVDVQALLATGPLSLRPWTYIDGNVDAGALTVPAIPFESLGVPASSPYFHPGDVVVVDPGGAHEELATLATVAPMRFTAPLAYAHDWGAMVLLAYPDAKSPGGDVDSLVPLVPARLLETRSGPDDKTVDGQFQGIGRVAANTTLELTVTNRGGVTADAEAVLLNVTSVSADGPGFVTVYPCGTTRPLASNVNYTTGQVVPNAVLAKVGTNGKVCLYTMATTDLVVDVNGYVPAGGSLATLVPARLLETRSGPDDKTVDGQFQGIGRVAANTTLELTVTNRGGVTADAEAVLLNVTSVSADGPGFVTVYPCGTTRPLASNVNYTTGQVVPNAVLAKVGTNGKVCLYTMATTDLVVDVNGYVP